MPWKHFAVAGGFKVWKIDEQGKKVGEPLSKKPMPEAAAKNQVRALYASENKPKKEAPEGAGEAEVIITEATDSVTAFNNNITPGDSSGTTDITAKTAIVHYAESESKEAKNMMMDEGMAYSPMNGACTWEEMEAMEETEELTKAYYKMSDAMGMMAHNVMQNPMVEDKAGALADLAEGYAKRVKGMADGEMEMEKELSGEPSPTFIDKLKGWLGLDTSQDEDDRPDELKAVWTAKYINTLPNSSFLYVEPDCKTKACRHFPVKDASGQLDLAHLRNAIARIPQSNAPRLTPEKKTQLQERARKMLGNAKEQTLFIWKEGDTYRWLATYSNNRRDEDNPPEIISTGSNGQVSLMFFSWAKSSVNNWHRNN